MSLILPFIKCLPLFSLLFLSSNLISKGTHDQTTAEIDSLLELSKKSSITVNIESAIEYSYQSLYKSEEIDYSKGKAVSYLNLARALFYLGSYDKSLEYLLLVEQKPYSAGNPLIRFEVSRVRGQIFSYLKLNNKSINEFHKCLSIAPQIEPKQDCDYCLSLTYENLGFVYETIDKPDSVYYYMNMNRELLESMDESFIYRNLVNLYTSLGNWYAKESNFDLAAENFDKALSIANEFQYPYLSRTLMFIGDMEMDRNNPDSAFLYYNKALDNLEETKIKGEFPLIYQRIALLYESIGALDSVVLYRKKQDLIDQELRQETENSTEHAFQIILNEEKSLLARKRSKLIALMTLSILILVIAFIIIWRITQKRIKEKNEQEALILKTRLDEYLKLIKAKGEKTKILEQRLNDSFDEVVALAKSNDSTFLRRFQEIYPGATVRILKKHPNLTNNDLTLCAMISLNFSSKEIASYTFVEHRTVQTKKSRLRKKLNLSAGASLEYYLNSFF